MTTKTRARTPKKQPAINAHCAERIGESYTFYLTKDSSRGKAGDTFTGIIVDALPPVPDLVALVWEGKDGVRVFTGYLGIKSNGSLYLIHRHGFFPIKLRDFIVVANIQKAETKSPK